MHEELLKKFKDLQDKLPVWRKQHGIFQTDIMRIEKSAEKIYHEYLDVMIKYRQSRRQSQLKQCNNMNRCVCRREFGFCFLFSLLACRRILVVVRACVRACVRKCTSQIFPKHELCLM